MKNVLVLGASGTIARQVIDLLAKYDSLALTLFLRSARRLGSGNAANARVVEGDVLHYDQLQAAVAGQDIVYVNLAGDLARMAQNVVRAMTEAGVKRVIFISSIGIYDTPLKPVLRPYRQAADAFETSALDYTVLRPAWFTTANEVDYEITRKGEPERGSVISQKSLATFIAQLIASPERYVRESLGINKPGS
ncbi:Rossmann-fold NAD(P)-binding domain-containing protein [Hymenobacter daeguensis]